MNKLIDYFEQYALASLEKQEKLSRLIHGHLCELDMDAWKIRFNSGLEFNFQVLGTESENTLTWLWAWADEQTEIPRNLIVSSLELKDWGEQHAVREFFIPGSDLDKAGGEMISLIASEVCGASCYYRDQYEGGSLFLLLFSEAIDKQPAFNPSGLLRRFQELAEKHDFNHKHALVSYLRMRNIPFIEKGRKIIAEFAPEEELTIEFDDSECITTSSSSSPAL